MPTAPPVGCAPPVLIRVGITLSPLSLMPTSAVDNGSSPSAMRFLLTSSSALTRSSALTLSSLVCARLIAKSRCNPTSPPTVIGTVLPVGTPGCPLLL